MWAARPDYGSGCRLSGTCLAGSFDGSSPPTRAGRGKTSTAISPDTGHPVTESLQRAMLARQSDRVRDGSQEEKRYDSRPPETSRPHGLQGERS